MTNTHEFTLKFPFDKISGRLSGGTFQVHRKGIFCDYPGDLDGQQLAYLRVISRDLGLPSCEGDTTHRLAMRICRFMERPIIRPYNP